MLFTGVMKRLAAAPRRGTSARRHSRSAPSGWDHPERVRPVWGEHPRLGGRRTRSCDHRSVVMGMPAPPSSGPNRIVNVRALWAGGAASAVVAALVAVVGVILCEDVLDLEMVPPPLLPIGWSLAVQYAVTSAFLALAATGLAHLLTMTTPRPESFLSWIVGLATVVGVALSLAGSGSRADR